MPKTQQTIKTGLSYLPNALTLGNLLGGFLAIVFSQSAHFEWAVISILVGAFCDAVDGPAARLTGSQSRMGAELDSLADSVSFGVAPAILIFSWLTHLEKDSSLGILSISFNFKNLVLACAFAYAACAILRLARFNTQTYDGSYFRGLPSPAAAMNLLASYGILGYWYPNVPQVLVVIIVLFVLIASAFSMVASIPFPKRVLNKKHPFRILSFVILLIAVFIYQPMLLLFLPFAYWLWGFVLWTYKRVRHLKSLLSF